MKSAGQPRIVRLNETSAFDWRCTQLGLKLNSAIEDQREKQVRRPDQLIQLMLCETAVQLSDEAESTVERITFERKC